MAQARLLPAILALAAAYTVAGKLGLALALVHPSATAVWPPTGLAVAGLLLLSRSLWPGVWLGAFVVNVSTAGSVATSLGIATGNTLEALAAAYLVRRFAAGVLCFEQPQNTLKFALFAAGIATTVSATVGVLSLALGGAAAWANAGAIWLTWWLGDVGGALIVAPVLILWGSQPRLDLPGRRALEAGALLAALLLASSVAFAVLHPLATKNYAAEFFVAPVLTWAALRFGPRETATAMLIMSGLAVWGTVHGVGPFGREPLAEALLLLQLFIGVMGLTVLSLSVAVTAGRRTEARVRRLQAAATELAGALSRSDVAQVLIAQTIAALGARAGSVVLLTEDAQQVVLAASRGYPAESLDAWRAFSVDAPVPLAEAIRTGQAVWLPSDDAWLRDYLHLTHHHRQMGGAAAAAVPLVAGSQPIGAIGLTFDLPQRFGDDDRQLIWALAHQGAVALERARLYDGELAARTAAESAARLRDEFLSVAAHELRTPLAGLYAFAQLLGRQYARAGTTDPSLLQRGVEVIAQQADKLSRLIGQLLDISRLETRKLQLDLEPSDLAEVVRQVVARVRLQDPQHPIDIQGPSTLPAVVDSLRLEQVVTNLVDNALRYSPDGLPIEIELERDGAAWARLAVRDHGPGVAAEHRQRIFERFYQVEIQRHRPGLGLGLYISRQIVDLHGGELIAEFPSDGGSRFVIRLPLDGRPSDAEMPAAPGVQSADGAADRSPGAAY